MKQAMVKSIREVCGSVRVRGKNSKSVWWNDEIKARDEDPKERGMEVYIEEKRNFKRCIYNSKKKVNEQLGRKMNQDVNGNRKLFWKEVNNVRGKV